MVWTEVWFTMPCCSLLRLWKCQHPESPEIPEELLNIAGKHQHDHYLVEFPTHVCSTWNAKSHSLALQTDQRPVNTVSPSDSESWQNGAARAAIGNYISFLHWFSEVHYPHAYKFSITSCSKGGVQSSIKHPMQPSPICGGVTMHTQRFSTHPPFHLFLNSQLASVGRRSVWMTELCPLSGYPWLEDTLSATYPAGWVFWVGKQERWDLSQNRPRRHTVPTHPPYTKLALLHQQSSLFLPTMHTQRFSTHPPFHLFLNSQLASVGRRSVWMTELCPLSGYPWLEDTLSATYPHLTNLCQCISRLQRVQDASFGGRWRRARRRAIIVVGAEVGETNFTYVALWLDCVHRIRGHSSTKIPSTLCSPMAWMQVFGVCDDTMYLAVGWGIWYKIFGQHWFCLFLNDLFDHLIRNGNQPLLRPHSGFWLSVWLKTSRVRALCCLQG